VGPASGTLRIDDGARGGPHTVQLSGPGIAGVAGTNCSKATGSDPNLTELFPLLFLPENIKGVTGPRGEVAVSITGITQDKPVTGGLLLCQDATTPQSRSRRRLSRRRRSARRTHRSAG
jgi:hypothetical protein